MSKVITQKTYIVGVHRYAFRAGEVAEIITLKYVKPTGYNWRLAMEVQYADGFIDYVAFGDVTAGNYEIISDVQLGLGQIPVIKY